MRSFLKISVILLLGGYTAYRFCVHLDHNFLFDSVIDVVLAAVTAIFYALYITKGIRAYRQNKDKKGLVPMICCFCVMLISGIIYSLLLQRDSSPVTLSCVSEIVDFNGITIDFRADGSYKFTSWCMGYDITRGKYTRKDSLISLDKSNIDKAIVSNRLLIRKNLDDGDTLTKYRIYQVNASGQMLPYSDVYRVLTDTHCSHTLQ